MIEVTIRTQYGDEPRFQLIAVGPPTAADAPARAAVSALVQSLTCQLARADWRMLEDLAQDGVPGSDWCAVTAVPTADGLPLVEGAFGLAAAGFGLLALRFPAQLRLTREVPEETACG